MRILSRYFLASYFSLFALVLASSTIAIAIVEMLLNFDQMVARREGFGGIATYLLLRIPYYYLRDLIPVSSFAAAFLCLALPARWREITAIKAGGVSPPRVTLALFGAAAVLSAFALVVNETVVLKASRELQRLNRAGDEITFRRGSFWYHRAGVIYNVREADRETRTLHGVRVFERDPDGRLRRSILADRVEIENDRDWRFIDATFRSFESSDPSAPPVTERTHETVMVVAEERDLALLDASAQTLALRDLAEYIEALSVQGRSITRYRAMLYERLVDPLTVLLFAALAIPLGLSVDQNRNIAVAALQGLAILGAFYTVKTIASILAGGGYPLAATGPWLAFAAFGGFGLWRLARVPR